MIIQGVLEWVGGFLMGIAVAGFYFERKNSVDRKRKELWQRLHG